VRVIVLAHYRSSGIVRGADDAVRRADVPDARDGELRGFAIARAGPIDERRRGVLARSRPVHPFDHHKAFHAIIAAGPPLAELALSIGGGKEMLVTLARACGDLGAGFAAPPGSRTRTLAYHRAWRAVRDLDRSIADVLRRRLAKTDVAVNARRAIDRADIEIGALPGVLST
jgi:hypothetical protein